MIVVFLQCVYSLLGVAVLLRIYCLFFNNRDVDFFDFNRFLNSFSVFFSPLKNPIFFGILRHTAHFQQFSDFSRKHG